MLKSLQFAIIYLFVSSLTYASDGENSDLNDGQRFSAVGNYKCPSDQAECLDDINYLFPLEMVSRCLSFVDTETALSARLVCTAWNGILNDEVFIKSNPHLRHLPQLKAQELLTAIKMDITAVHAIIRDLNHRDPGEPAIPAQYQECLTKQSTLNDDFIRKMASCPNRLLRKKVYQERLGMGAVSETTLKLAYHYTLEDGERVAQELLWSCVKAYADRARWLGSQPPLVTNMLDELREKISRVIEDEKKLMANETSLDEPHTLEKKYIDLKLKKIQRGLEDQKRWISQEKEALLRTCIFLTLFVYGVYYLTVNSYM